MYKAGHVFGAGLSLAASLAACQTPDAEPPSTTAIETTTTLGPDEFDPALARDFRELLMQDAAVQIVFVPPAEPAERTWNEFVEESYQQLLNNDPSFESYVLEGFWRRSSGRYTPDEVIVTFAEVFDSGNTCFDRDAEGLAVDLYEHAEQYRDPNALSITYYDQPACTDETGEQTLGFGLPGYSPTILQGGFVGFSENATHEGGHASHLGHANTLACDNPVLLTNCEVVSDNDSNTLMSARNSFGTNNSDFTAPELNFLGLLRPEEVLTDPEPGEYLLSATSGAFVDEALPKLIVLNTTEGRVFISSEDDASAHVDQTCRPTSEVIGDSTYTDRGMFTIDGTEMNISCGLGDTRDGVFSSLQVRTPNDAETVIYSGFSLIARPTRTPEDVFERPTSGEVYPETVVYRNESITVTLVGISLGTAAIRIDNNR